MKCTRRLALGTLATFAIPLPIELSLRPMNGDHGGTWPSEQARAEGLAKMRAICDEELLRVRDPFEGRYLAGLEGA